MMYTRLITAVTVLGLFMAVACKKDDPDPVAPANNTACNGMKLCFKQDGTEESYDNVDWRQIAANSNSPARYRILWEDGSGTTYQNIEMDIYASAEGTYTVNANNPHVANDAAFQRFDASSGKEIIGQSGTVTITSIDNANNTITGTFTVTASDGTITYEYTDGNFVGVPLKP